MGEQTKLTKATSKSDSLRTTIPSGIVRQFNMKEKDSLDWRIKIEGSKLVIVVNHIKQTRIIKVKKSKIENGPF